MNALIAAMAPYVHALGWSLLHFLWQGALIGLAYALTRGACAGSAARHRLGMFCLLAMLACPLATLAVLWPAHADPAIFAAGSSTALASASASGASAAAGIAQSAGLEAWLPWCVGLWLAGVCAIALRSFLHWHRLVGLVRSANALPRDWQLRLLELSQRFGILRPVRLLASLEVATPTLIGWLKPTILLPASLLSGFTPAQIELILAHELAHIRRYDYIANLIQVVVETLLFYHPLVHWICADVRQQREQCCDDLVLGVGGGERLAYARTLADLEEWAQGGAVRFGAAVPALGAGGGVLLERVRRIVDPRAAQSPMFLPRGNGMTLPVLLAGAGLLLALTRLHAPSADALDATLVRASATSAELIAAATLRIHADLPLLAQRIRPATVVTPLPRREAEHEPAVAAPPLPQTAARTEAPAAIAAARAAETPDAAAVAAPTVQAPAIPEPASAAGKTPPLAPAPVTAPGPQALHVVQPTYPLDALRNGVAGKVDLEFHVDGEGRVRDIRVLAAQPAGVFEQAAIAAMRQWRFAAPAAATRYTRSFAFTRGNTAEENCREITGSHICRRANSETDAN
ncbi:TonB family protein [Rudaea sp.]|uniref:M56 family metallopeptidase n=1 Tax=Rudaea sp. TaxID=2136325 RepID=UPI00321FD47E